MVLLLFPGFPACPDTNLGGNSKTIFGFTWLTICVFLWFFKTWLKTLENTNNFLYIFKVYNCISLGNNVQFFDVTFCWDEFGFPEKALRYLEKKPLHFSILQTCFTCFGIKNQAEGHSLDLSNLFAVFLTQGLVWQMCWDDHCIM